MNRTVFKVRFKVGPMVTEHDTNAIRRKRSSSEGDTNNTKAKRTLRTPSERATNQSFQSDAFGGSLRRPQRLYKYQTRTGLISNAFLKSTTKQHNIWSINLK